MRITTGVTRFLGFMVFLGSLPLAGQASVPAQCSATASGTSSPRVEIRTIQRELPSQELARIAGGGSLGEALAFRGLDLHDLDQRSAMLMTVAGTFEHTVYSFSRTKASAADTVVLFSTIPDQVREEMVRQNVDPPFSGFVLHATADAPPDVQVFGIPGRFRYDARRGFDVVPSQGATEQKDFSQCVSCVVDVLKSFTCDAVTAAILCGPPWTWPTTCLGEIANVLIRNFAASLLNASCGITLNGALGNCTACLIPSIQLSPGSNATLQPGQVQVQISVNGGGWQAANWVAVFRNGSVTPVVVDLHLGSSGSTNWSASSGTYAILGGNVPSPIGLSGIPWVGTSTNVVVGSVNQPPNANFTFTTSGLTAYFSDTSTDSDGTIVSRSWNFGDGTSSTAANPSKTYSSAGTRTVSLTVTDNGGKSASIGKSVTVTGGSGGGCTGTTYSGSLASGQGAVQPNGNFYQSTAAGLHSGRLTGPANADFDLYLYKWNGSAWTRVASSEGGTSNESISYSGTAGYYYWLVYAYSGSGSYTLCINRP